MIKYKRKRLPLAGSSQSLKKTKMFSEIFLRISFKKFFVSRVKKKYTKSLKKIQRGNAIYVLCQNWEEKTRKENHVMN